MVIEWRGMNQMSENKQDLPEEKRFQEMPAKARAFARGPHGELFLKVVESFLNRPSRSISPLKI